MCRNGLDSAGTPEVVALEVLLVFLEASAETFLQAVAVDSPENFLEAVQAGFQPRLVRFPEAGFHHEVGT